MSECDAMKSRMPELIAESLGGDAREKSYLHIENCPSCRESWEQWRETWNLLGAVAEVTPSARVRERFLAEVEGMRPAGRVVPLRRRTIYRRLAEAAAVVVLVGSSYYGGHRAATSAQAETPARLEAASSAPFSIAENLVVPASQMSPNIEGQPEIRNVRFVKKPGEGGDQVEVAFDVTSHLTVTGKPDEKSLVRLMSYVLGNDQDHPTISKSNAMEWVKQTYAGESTPDPDLVKAVAGVLANDSHEGVRLKAVEALKGMAPGAATEARSALIEALKNDPNPAVRIKAIDALANLARSGNSFDAATVDMLREKANQQDENLYVRVKAAEALSQINL